MTDETELTAEERAEWRKDAEMGRAYTWRVLRLLDALEDAERARTPATTALTVTAARDEERCMAVGYGQQCVGRAGHGGPHDAPGRDGGMWVGLIGPSAATAAPEIPLAAQREAELRATERPVPRPTR